jgi:hypothetical protein
MKIKKYKQLNETVNNETDFQVGDMIIYDISYMHSKGEEKYIAKVLRSDLPKYQLLKIRIYHDTLDYTDTTVSSIYCEKFKE